jgi:hypothetical protein
VILDITNRGECTTCRKQDKKEKRKSKTGGKKNVAQGAELKQILGILRQSFRPFSLYFPDTVSVQSSLVRVLHRGAPCGISTTTFWLGSMGNFQVCFFENFHMNTSLRHNSRALLEPTDEKTM